MASTYTVSSLVKGERPPRSRLYSATAYFVTAQLCAALTLLLGFFTTPLLLRWLGAERFGLLRVLTSWSSYLGILPGCVLLIGGIGLVPLLARGEGKKTNEFLAAVGGGLFVVAGLAIVMGLGMALALPWLAPAPHWLAQERGWAFAILIFGVLLIPFQLAKTLFEADQRGNRVSMVFFVQALAATGLALLVARAGWGLPGQTLAAVCGALISAVLLILWARREYSWIRLQRPARSEVRVVWAATLGQVALNTFGILASGVEPIAVNYSAGSAAVTNYFLSQRLFFVFSSQVAVISSVVWAPMSDMFHRGQSALLHLRVRETLQLICAVSYAGGVALLAYDRDFVSLWVGPERYGGDAMALAFVLATPLLGLNAFYGWILNATGHRRELLAGAAWFAVVLLISSAGLGWKFGPVGVAWGIVLAHWAIWLWYYPYKTHKALGITRGDLFSPYLQTTLLAIPVGAICWWWARFHKSEGWIQTGAAMAAMGLFYLLAYWILFLTRTDRAGWLQNVRSIWQRSAGVGPEL